MAAEFSQSDLLERSPSTTVSISEFRCSAEAPPGGRVSAIANPSQLGLSDGASPVWSSLVRLRHVVVLREAALVGRCGPQQRPIDRRQYQEARVCGDRRGDPRSRALLALRWIHSRRRAEPVPRDRRRLVANGLHDHLATHQARRCRRQNRSRSPSSRRLVQPSRIREGFVGER
jgi:hypothetical protein